MPVIILAGGLGIRLRGIIQDRPKPMAEVLNKPFLEYILYSLKAQGFKDVIIAVSYMKEKIMEYFEDGSCFGLNIRYSIENSPLGTGGAIKKASLMIDGNRFLCINGDTYFKIDLNELINYHLSKNAKITLAIKSTENTLRYGCASINDDGLIICFKEKAINGRGLINAGTYIFEKSIFDTLQLGAYSLENDILPKFVGNGLYGLVLEGYFIDLGIPEDYMALSQEPDEFIEAVRSYGGKIW